jgi:hypothetical protein
MEPKNDDEKGRFDTEYQGWGMCYNSYRHGRVWLWKTRTLGVMMVGQMRRCSMADNIFDDDFDNLSPPPRSSCHQVCFNDVFAPNFLMDAL